ncbi:MAG: NUDIX domain-containing protein [Parcubacteria group bacterium]|nr:NUDIX domain-containing protein [Parcubacteria group bacterium]
MKHEISAGAIIYFEDGEKRTYLLLKSKKGHWDFTKGHVEGKETRIEAARREIMEEAGFMKKDLEFIDGFHKEITYTFSSRAIAGEDISKVVTYYLASVRNQEVFLSDEHDEYGWYPYKDALHALKFKNARALLIAAEEFLNKNTSA